MMFRSRAPGSGAAAAQRDRGCGLEFRGTLMVHGTLRIDGEFEGDILDCDRLEIGEHGLMRADVEVKEAVIHGRVHGNIRALGSLEMKQGSHVEGDVAAVNVVMEAGVYFTGRCTMLDTGTEASRSRPRAPPSRLMTEARCCVLRIVGRRGRDCTRVGPQDPRRTGTTARP